MSVIKRFEFQAQLFTDARIRMPSRPDQAIFLLHGYQQSGELMFQALESFCPPNAAVIAPNAPFMVPFRKAKRFLMGHSWYFYDFEKDDYIVDMKTSVELLTQMVKELGLSSLPITWVGFSQGGYLAPFVAQKIPQSRRVIGIGCEFLKDELVGDLPFRMDQIHGAADSIVDPINAARSHEILRSRGVQGEFVSLPGVEHDVSGAVGQELKKFLLA